MPSTPEPPRPGEENLLPQLADFLTGAPQGPHLTVRWLRAVRRNPKVPSDAELADHLSRLFKDLENTLRGDPDTVEHPTDNAEQPGAHRWQQDYSLTEILDELGIASRLVLADGLDAFEDAHPASRPPAHSAARAMRSCASSTAPPAAASPATPARQHELLDARDALRESEARYRQVIEGAGLGTFEWELPSRRVRWNRKLKELFFLPPDTEMSFEVGIAHLHPRRPRADPPRRRGRHRPPGDLPDRVSRRVAHRRGALDVRHRLPRR